MSALGTIIEWYKALPPRARSGLSLENLHGLSKMLEGGPAKDLVGLGWKLSDEAKAHLDALDQAQADGARAVLEHPETSSSASHRLRGWEGT